MRLQVAAAIIEQEDSLLICQRPEGKHLALLWEFPGGKTEENETPAACIVRECREELGIEVEVLSLFREMTYDYPDRSIFFTFFRCRIRQGQPKSLEGQRFCWVKKDELKTYAFCPADETIIRLLQS